MFSLTTVSGLLLTVFWTSLLFAKRLKRNAWAYCPEVPAIIRSASIVPTDQGTRCHVGYVIYGYQIENQDYSGLCAFHSRRGEIPYNSL